MESLPLLRFGRVLIPGTRHSIRTEREDLAVGERVVVVLVQPDGTLSRVGTASRIQGVGPAEGDRLILDLMGETLVFVEAAGDQAAVEPVDKDASSGYHDLVTVAERSLRRYLAVMAEAGRGGDVLATVDRDPVMASNQVASYLDISWPEVQDILEAGEAGERLEREIKVLERETALLRAVLGRSD